MSSRPIGRVNVFPGDWVLLALASSPPFLSVTQRDESETAQGLVWIGQLGTAKAQLRHWQEGILSTCLPMSGGPESQVGCLDILTFFGGLGHT